METGGTARAGAKKKEEKTVFQQLLEDGICFAVCVSINTFKNKGIDISSKDYFLIIKASDSKNMSVSLGFRKTHSIHPIMERHLNEDEIREFKDLSDKIFVKVQNDESGRIYELKNNSFRKHYHEFEYINNTNQ